MVEHIIKKDKTYICNISKYAIIYKNVEIIELIMNNYNDELYSDDIFLKNSNNVLIEKTEEIPAYSKNIKDI